MMRRLVMAAALLIGSATACSDGSTGGPGSGRTQVLLTDDPFSGGDIARVDLYIARIQASAGLDTLGSDSLSPSASWVTIAEPQKTFNLLDLQQGTTALAGEVDLPAGQYRAIRVTINTGLSHVVRLNGTDVMVQWPVQGELALYAYVENALEVPAGGAQIVIDFDVNRTFVDNGSGGLWFIPWIRAVNSAETGSVAGTVKGPSIEGDPVPVAGAYVMAITSPGPGAMGAITASTRTDADGHYVIGYLREGDYSITVQAPEPFVFNTGTVPATIAVGQRTTVNLSLTRDTGGVDTTGTGGGGTPTGPVASVTLQPSTQTVSVGDSVPVMAMLKNAQDEMLSGRAVTWAISDSTKLSVFGSYGNWAVLRALHSGTVTITATSEGKSGTGTVTIR
jgi:hypothetical protein